MSSAPERRGLGRGLEVLLGGVGSSELAELPVDAIHPNPRQPRRRFDSEAGAGLAETAAKFVGRTAPRSGAERGRPGPVHPDREGRP